MSLLVRLEVVASPRFHLPASPGARVRQCALVRRRIWAGARPRQRPWPLLLFLLHLLLLLEAEFCSGCGAPVRQRQPRRRDGEQNQNIRYPPSSFDFFSLRFLFYTRTKLLAPPNLRGGGGGSGSRGDGRVMRGFFVDRRSFHAVVILSLK